jgi:hypothetical protein
MTDTYKVLGQKVTDGTSTPMYSVPEGKQSVLSAIEITNAGNSTANYSVSVTRDNDTSKGVFLLPNTYDDNTLLYSNDAINWRNVGKPFSAGRTTNPYSSNGGTDNSLKVDKNIFYYVATGWDSSMFTYTPEIEIVSSSDGLNWSTIPAPIFDIYTIHRHTGFHVYNGIIVLALVDIDNNVTKLYVSSDLGQNWTMTKNFGYVASIAFSTFKNKIIYHVFGMATQYYSSTDGVTWEANYTDGPYTILNLSVEKVNNTEILMAIGQSFSNGDVGTYYSYNGNNMFQSTGYQDHSFTHISSTDNGIYAIAIDQVESNGGQKVLYSSNGAVWSLLGTLPAYTFSANYHDQREFIASNDRLIATGYNYYAYSDNLSGTLGTSWTSISVEEAHPRDNWASDGAAYKKTSTENFIVYEKSILSGQTEEIKAGITLSSKDSIDIQSVSNSIIANGYGVEIS